MPPKIGMRWRKGPDLFAPINVTPIFQNKYEKILGKIPVYPIVSIEIGLMTILWLRINISKRYIGNKNKTVKPNDI